ncbi:MAG: hypothetical protein ACXU8S_08490 [Phenylobacterium sp.]
MRLFIAAPLILACGFAAPALAQQPTNPAPNPAPTQDKPAATSRAASQAEAAAQALAISMRHQEEQDRRIAEIACRAGDQAKCAALQAMSQPSTKSSGQ